MKNLPYIIVTHSTEEKYLVEIEKHLGICKEQRGPVSILMENGNQKTYSITYKEKKK
ncbi:MAG: hypothetical protein AABX88_02270 [Nanoarchaeota archaeon]